MDLKKYEMYLYIFTYLKRICMLANLVFFTELPLWQDGSCHNVNI